MRALRERFFVGDTFAEFCAAFTAETNRIRIEQRASLSSIKRELAHVKHDIEKVIDAIVQGYAGPELKERMAALQVRKGALTAQLASADAPLPLLHPSMADDFGRKVEALTTTLTTGDQHGAAREALRGLIDKVVVPPGDGLLMIHGNLGKMLEASGGKDCKNGCGGAQPAVLAAVERGGVERMRRYPAVGPIRSASIYDVLPASSATPTTKLRITSRCSPAPSASRSSKSGRITIPDPRIRGRAR